MFYKLIEEFEKVRYKEFYSIEQKTSTENIYNENGEFIGICQKKWYEVVRNILDIATFPDLLKKPYYATFEEAEKIAAMCNMHLKMNNEYKKIYEV